MSRYATLNLCKNSEKIHVIKACFAPMRLTDSHVYYYNNKYNFFGGNASNNFKKKKKKKRSYKFSWDYSFILIIIKSKCFLAILS